MSQDKKYREWTVFIVDESFECLYDDSEPLPTLDSDGDSTEELVPVIERKALDELKAENEKLIQTLNNILESAKAVIHLTAENAQLTAALRDMVGALEYLYGCSQNEMIARGLPLEWTGESGLGKAEQTLTKHADLIGKLKGEHE